MREIALLLLLVTPSWGIFSGPHRYFENVVAPKPTTAKVETAKPTFIIPSPTRLTTDTYIPSAAATYSIDYATGGVLQDKSSDTRVEIASLTKLMTAYVFLKDQPDLDRVVTVPSYSLQPGDAVMGVNVSEQIKLRDLLAGVLIPSGSDAAQAIATIDSGNVSAFVVKMNQKATDLGLTNTHFTNPVGWDDVDNYSSAKDIASLTRILLASPVFADLTSTRVKTVYTTAGRPIQLTSTNELLGTDGYIGVKTGYTFGAGQCLVSLENKDGHQILTVILGSGDRFGETVGTNAWTNTHFLW